MTAPFRTALTALALVALSAPAALAHPKLLSTTPQANDKVAAPSAITLHFNEALQPEFTGATLTAHVVLPGKPAQDMAVKGVAAKVDAKDKKALVIKPRDRLSPGLYRVDWHAVGDDTHRTTGTFVFTVK